jgi:rfaE bifunctional protein kinase chain/domain
MKTRLSRSRLVELLDRCQSLKVGVIGDFTLDAYWYADMNRAQISRETPLYARPVIRETYSPGGAANVAWNLADLGIAQVIAFTVLGQDWRGALFRKILEEIGVSLAQTIFTEHWSTPLYGKVVLMNRELMQEDPRLDFVNTQPLPDPVEMHLLSNLRQAAESLDALIIADYQVVGVFSNRLRSAVNELASHLPRLVCVADSRQQIGSFPAMILKPNEAEAARLLFPDRVKENVTEGDLKQGGLRLTAKTGKPVYITQGERGCLLVDAGEVCHLPAIYVPPPIDPVGAGDTFIASLTACLAAGATPLEAGLVANLAASVTVRLLHMTGTASPQAVLDQYDSL